MRTKRGTTRTERGLTQKLKIMNQEIIKNMRNININSRIIIKVISYLYLFIGGLYSFSSDSVLYSEYLLNLFLFISIVVLIFVIRDLVSQSKSILSLITFFFAGFFVVSYISYHLTSSTEAPLLYMFLVILSGFVLRNTPLKKS